jgi:hypothetical protein
MTALTTAWTLLKSPKGFPTLILALEVVATIRYAVGRDWWHAAYWLFSVELVALCTFWTPK